MAKEGNVSEAGKRGAPNGQSSAPIAAATAATAAAVPAAARADTPANPANPVNSLGQEDHRENSTPQDAAPQKNLALLEAAKKGDLERVRALLPLADLSLRTQGGKNALQEAVRFHHAECVREMLPWFDAKAKGYLGYTVLMDAAADGWVEGVALLLSVSDADAKNKHGTTALMLATGAERHGAECLRLMVPHCDAKIICSQGRSALNWAATSTPEHVEALLPVSEPRRKDIDGTTALMIAAMSGHDEIVEVLLPVSEPRATDKNGKTALDYALDHPNFNRRSQIADRIRMAMSAAEKAELAAEMASAEAANANPASRRAPRTL